MEWFIAGMATILIVFVVINVIVGKRHSDEEFVGQAATQPLLTTEDMVLLKAAQQKFVISSVSVNGITKHYVADAATEKRLFVIDADTLEITPIVRLAAKKSS